MNNKTYLLCTDHGVVSAYLALDDADRIVDQLSEVGVQAWIEEVPINPLLVTHIVTGDRMNIERHGAAVVSASESVMQIGQARAVAGFLERDGSTLVGYGFGVERAVACMLDRAGLAGNFTAMQVAA